jgi:uncharacterized protein
MIGELRDVTPYCRIRIDKEGKWFYENNEIINPLVLRSFCQALEKDDQGRYRIVMDSEICYVEIEDTPFVISAIRGDPQCGLYLRMNNLETHPLDPEQLSVGEDNVLYTMLPDGMKVRFTRPAYYALALMMEEDQEGNIVLMICGKSHVIFPKSSE